MDTAMLRGRMRLSHSGFLFRLAYVVEYDTHKGKDNADEQRPFRYLASAAADRHGV